jgi:hypothetical protein
MQKNPTPRTPFFFPDIKWQCVLWLSQMTIITSRVLLADLEKVDQMMMLYCAVAAR